MEGSRANEENVGEIGRNLLGRGKLVKEKGN